MSDEPHVNWLRWLLWFAAMLLLIMAVIGAWTYQALLRPVGANMDRVSVTVVAGQSADEITRTLEDRGIIASSIAVRGFLRVTNQSFKAGIYTLTPGRSSIENVQPMLSGAVAERQVTIPEGLRLTEIAALLDRAQVIGAADLLNGASYRPTLVLLPVSYDLLADTFLEGFLFPDTYRFAVGATADAVVERLVTTYLERTAGLDLDYETLILASIVEREAKFDADRPIIASVYRNRLALGMPLQADPTVQYAVGENSCSELLGTCDFRDATKNWWQPLTTDDLTIDSPFNTYRNPGLPPRPICNPGLKSLEAAAKPAESEFLYFVTDAEGYAHFAVTLDEHNANVAKYLR